MFDPAVLGTALIGLEAIRRDADRSSLPHPRPERPRRRRARTRQLMAAILRRMAARVESAPLPAR